MAISLELGTKLGQYEIVSAIGAGGMGEVYRARDNKLGRDVAIKVLPEEFTQHPQKLARFEREARFLAALNHPGIATLHGLEEAEGQPFLVMELVEGETLAERIGAGPLPVKEAMTLALAIAEALEAAHERGVIHRDLKPANIKVDPEGHVKVLDFGLAKAFADDVPESDISLSPTLSRDATKAGVILGTAAYMSPEQARGKALDKRTDIFSFGMVLYEMLTGKRAFTGEDVSDVLASIMKLDPDWKALPADVPPSLAKLLRRCLTKDRKKRLQAIGDARNEIEELLGEPAAAPPSAEWTPRTIRVWQGVAGLLAATLLATLWILWPAEGAPELPIRLSVQLGAGDHRLATGGSAWAVLSPDGRMLAFVGQTETGGTQQLFIRSLDSLEATPLSGTEGAGQPFFSPDSQWLAFRASGALKKVSVSGGAALTLTEVGPFRGGTWGPDDTIVYSSNTTGLFRVPASGGTPVELTTLGEGEGSHRLPWFLPNGKAVLFMSAVVDSQSGDDATIEAVVLETGQRKVLHQGGTHPRYASSGHLLYVRESTLFAMPFDADRVEATSEPSPVLEGIRRPVNDVALYSVANNGSLVYVPGGTLLDEVPRELVRVDREGNASPLTTRRGDFEGPRLSPDGQRLAVRKGPNSDQDIWILELSRGTLTPLTFEEGILPLWSPDGERVFFSAIRGEGNYNIFSKPADGAGPAEQVTTGGTRVFSGSITSDGNTLVFRQGGLAATPSFDIGMVHLDGDREQEMLLETSFNEHTPKVSPDDRWLAYVSDDSGRDEVYVSRFPTGGKWQISTEGGREPVWSRDGRELFYRNGEKMMAVDVSAGADKPGQPIELFEGPYDLKDGPGASNYDVTPDGQGFVMIRTPDTRQGAGITQVHLVLNWFEELKQLAPTN